MNTMHQTQSKFLFFTGKGGVGKTSIACATAIKLVDEGKKVLLISTDPASNLEDVLGDSVLDKIKSHKNLAHLFTININPETAAKEYRFRALNPIKNIASELDYKKLDEGLSGACTTEIASFDEFSRFITGEGNPEKYDHIVFDTAPTGHTIRLLELPAAWSNFLEKNPHGASCIGPSVALKSSKERYKKVMNSLRDEKLTSIYLVSKPETSALKEAARTSQELKSLGLTNQKLIINGLYEAIDSSDELAIKIQQIAKKELAEMPLALKNMAMQTFPLLPYNVLGIEKLRSLFDKDLQKVITQKENNIDDCLTDSIGGINDLANVLEREEKNGLIMTMGKGGVGKTIVAAALAVILANKGHKVLLTTTDPAAHLKDFMKQLPRLPESLSIERIDPKEETKIYTDKIYAQKSQGLNEDARKLLAEDLKSPCNEEVAVFHAFSKAIQKAKRQFVVMDTAPTGHSLLLLDTTGKYHKEILKSIRVGVDKITTPLMSLQNPRFAKILLVSLPETTPMREAEALQKDLKRAGIKPYSWVINQCLSAVPNIKDALLKKRAANETSVIKNIDEKLSEKTYLIPFIAEENILPELLSIGHKSK